jgi:hypothetical protein
MLSNLEQKYNSYDFSGAGKNVSDLLFYKKNCIMFVYTSKRMRHFFRPSAFIMMARKIFKGKTNTSTYETGTRVIF